MPLSALSNVLKFFGAKEPTEEERQELVHELMLMTLARATKADSNIENCEVETVRRIVNTHTGREVSAADVRVAALSELYETAPLTKYLKKTGAKLSHEERAGILEALGEVIESDTKVRAQELEFFNAVAKALNVSAQAPDLS